MTGPKNLLHSLMDLSGSSFNLFQEIKKQLE